MRRLHHPADTLASYKRHEAIFDALVARDTVAAQAAMRAHFDAMKEAVDRLSERQGGSAS
jgi:DNA-binding GntR family transcriptional regulator